MDIKKWIKDVTTCWDEEHEKLAKEIASELIWYSPKIRKRILKQIESELADAENRSRQREKGE